MGYFSNGTEGLAYQERYCQNCIHFTSCAVWDAHMLFNYEECNNKNSILHVFIPRKGINNLKCKMFKAKKGRPDPDEGEPLLFEGHEIGHGPKPIKESA